MSARIPQELYGDSGFHADRVATPGGYRLKALRFRTARAS